MDLFYNCLIILVAAYVVHGNTGCIGENGKPVDMFIIYKLPTLSDYADIPHLEEGKAYAYMDSDKPTFRLGSKAITDQGSPTGLTLSQVYHAYGGKNNRSRNAAAWSKIAHVFYNDEDPEGEGGHGSYGHTKGAVAFDKSSGFWLIHSVPKFPIGVFAGGYEYPQSGLRYGQMMICVTFDASKFDDIGMQLIYNHPHIHDSHLPVAFKKHYPNMKSLLQRGRVKTKPFYRIINLKSSGGVEYRHFAKYHRFGKDLYHDLVAKDLKTDILTETWQHGKDIGPSCQGDFHVEDVSQIEIELSSQSISFSTMNDHSKFAIGKTASSPYVCIGDINRQPSQFKRGGGTMCFKNFDIWNQYYKFVDSYIGCDDKVKVKA